MKNTVIMICSCIFGAIALLLIMTMGGKINRKMEIQNDLPIVVEDTVDNLLLTKTYSIEGRNEFLADLVSELSYLLDNDSDINVAVLKADTEKGILSVQVTVRYMQPNGTDNEATCEKTVVLNKTTADEVEMCAVYFYLTQEDAASGRPYKVCKLVKGDCVEEPAEPGADAGTFVAWTDANGYLADFTQPVQTDTNFYAEFN